MNDINETKRRFSVGSSPHVSASDSTPNLMLDVLIALLPAWLVAVYFFGFRVVALTAVTIAATVGSEYLYRRLTHQHQTIGDLSAAVTGVLLAMTLPVETPYLVAIVGGVFAIVVVKQLFGGLGKNFMNPAMAGRVFLFSFTGLVTKYVAPGRTFWAPIFGSAAGQTDVVSAATPMSYLHQGQLPVELTLRQLLVGQRAGCIGEVAVLMLMLGGLYLVIRKVISPRIPLCFLGTVAVLTFLFPLGGVARTEWMAYNLLSGGLMLGAIFMATDYATSPVTPTGRTVYAVGCGALTVFLRYFGAYPEGVSFAILVMNTLVWSLDKVFMPHRFGTPWLKWKPKSEKKEVGK